ncbi:MAG: DNA polymerase III subunit delta [Candidatus Rokubacteria bacterium RIFCSPLOWO2_12_FULL_73_47]|nr:MAG: DNA polymerase III subunit delta [Candidatus Rokubacteria bacterium RIFCSPLOWO2_12_FULL_73_47]
MPPVALLHGPDVQLLDDALAAVTRRLFPDPGTRATGREVFDGEEASVDAIVQAAQTLPFMTATRLVAVRRAWALPPRDAAGLAAYARAPNPTSCLLLLSETSLAAGRERRTEHWLLGAVPAAATVALPAREGRTLEGWLRQRAAAEGLTVSEEAARLLVEWVGDDPARLLGEVRKASLAGGPEGRTLGVREVTAVVGEQRLAGVFDLTRAVGRRDAGAALRTLDRLLATEEPMRLLALLTGETRTAWSIAALRARGQSTEQIARTLRRPPAVVEAVGRAAAALPAAALARRLRRCWEVEDRLKSGGEARAEMTALVADLCAER